MSTNAPASALQAPPAICETRTFSVRGTPALTTPVEGSTRMSDRFNRSSTKYGPSVNWGVITHDPAVGGGDVGDVDVVEPAAALPHPSRPAAAAEPASASSSRRVRSWGAIVVCLQLPAGFPLCVFFLVARASTLLRATLSLSKGRTAGALPFSVPPG